jgi:hypothetical protein
MFVSGLVIARELYGRGLEIQDMISLKFMQSTTFAFAYYSLRAA